MKGIIVKVILPKDSFGKLEKGETVAVLSTECITETDKKLREVKKGTLVDIDSRYFSIEERLSGTFHVTKKNWLRVFLGI